MRTIPILHLAVELSVPGGRTTWLPLTEMPPARQPSCTVLSTQGQFSAQREGRLDPDLPSVALGPLLASNLFCYDGSLMLIR